MTDLNSPLLTRAANPFFLGGVVLAGVVVVTLGGEVARSAGFTLEPLFPWLVTTSFLMFFAIFNAVICLMSKDLERYWSRSMLAYMGLALLSGGLAHLISGYSIGEAATYKWLFVVVTFGYLIFLTIITLMRKIVEFAQREEWTQPRLRKKKRRR
ncbi:MAG: hypothetical protein D6765_12660 [Bacteroidetes bacterium]|nr:MAG: hypothetical protein D6765_12660 [Bacteroidota bacterium]